MSRPVLLVDDSEAILAFEREVLSHYYPVAWAMNGEEALRQARELRPALVLLDLSMPVMDGDEVLRRLKADPQLARIPVVIVSSEVERADECLDLGAVRFLPKPVKGDALLDCVVEMLDAARREERRESIATLPTNVGDLGLALPLALVQAVCAQPAALRLAGTPAHLAEAVEIGGRVIAVLDLALRLGVRSRARYEDRLLVVLDLSDGPLALAVDAAHEPEEIPSAAMVPRSALALGETALGSALIGVVRSTRGPLSLIDPGALLSRGAWGSLPALLSMAVRDAGAS